MPDPVGLFGKIPAQGDFFRANVADAAAQGLVAWLQDAIEPVYRARLRLPAAPVRFLFRVPGGATALVGAMGASADRVGRAFPLCVFAVAPAAALGDRYPAVPLAYRGFLDAASALLAEAGALDGPALAARAGALPVPGGAAVADADLALRREAASEGRDALSARLFGDCPAGALAYALGTFGSAVRPVRGTEPARAALALDCPAERDVDRWAWLELARRSLRWPGPPPFFWTEAVPGSVVVALGGAPAGLLAHLCDPARPGAKVWPLRTSQPAAVEAALRGLPAAAQRALDAPGLSVDALVGAAAA